MTAMSGTTMLFNNVYTYDKVDNILSITNNVPIPTQGLGGRTSSRFEYDEWNRLIFAEGNVATARNSGSFTLNMEYDKLFNIRRKNQFVDIPNAPQSLTHDFHYFYNCPSGPNRPSQIGSKLLEFDANGNPIVIHDTATGDFRRMIWDEENRLMFLSDNGNMHHFVYDHRGERVIKSNSGLQNVFMDGLPVGTLENNRRTVIYVSPYFVMRDGGFTKHYFAGTQRVLSKFGTGRFHNRFTPSNRVITAGNKNYIQRQQQLRQGLYDPMRELQIPPGNPTQRPNITRPDYTGQPRPTIVGNYEIPRGWPRQPTTAPPGGPPGPPIQWGPEITNDNVRAGYTYLPNSLKETAQFFFHPDHLGSTMIVTDRHGSITQFITYMPFGELLVNEHLTSQTTPFLFNAMEFDPETGLYYFHARYFEPRFAKFLTIDPMWELYPNVSGFAFVLQNPIRFIDPTGMVTEDTDGNIITNPIRTADFQPWRDGISRMETLLYRHSGERRPWNELITTASSEGNAGESTGDIAGPIFDGISGLGESLKRRQERIFTIPGIGPRQSTLVLGRILSTGGTAVGIGLGVSNIREGYVADGRIVGENTLRATFESAGGITGAILGGRLFGAPGAVAGGHFGGRAGASTYDFLHNQVENFNNHLHNYIFGHINQRHNTPFFPR